VSATTVPKHNIIVGQLINADDDAKGIALFPGKDEGVFAKAYKRNGEWFLVSDENYQGSGLIVFINNKKEEKPNLAQRVLHSLMTKRPMQVKITKVLPNVVFGEVL